MNDFLQSLRGGQKDKRTPKTRRGIDSNTNPHYNQPPSYPPHGGYQNPRGGNIKRVTRSNAPAKYPGQEIDLPVVNDDFAERALDVLDGFLKTQERLVDIQQRRIIIEERKADALEGIVEYLRSSALQGESKEGYDEPEPDYIPGEAACADTMGNECHGKENIEDLQPLFHHEPRDIRGGNREPVVETSSHDMGLPVVEQPEEAGEDMFFPETGFPAREKSVPIRRGPHKRSEHPDAGIQKRTARPIEQKESKPEVKVIKRTRADKARVAKVQIKTDEPVAASSPVEGILPREEVMKIIESMREKGATFDQVAKHLVDINQPTFSGRGEWHAQTVHRLCNRKK